MSCHCRSLALASMQGVVADVSGYSREISSCKEECDDAIDILSKKRVMFQLHSIPTELRF